MDDRQGRFVPKREDPGEGAGEDGLDLGVIDSAKSRSQFSMMAVFAADPGAGPVSGQKIFGSNRWRIGLLGIPGLHKHKRQKSGHDPTRCFSGVHRLSLPKVALYQPESLSAE